MEEEIFEVSLWAGIAENYQWGLDDGENQEENVYADVPASWNHNDREGNDRELEPPQPPRRKPRPLQRRKNPVSKVIKE
ncbi:hypothetical protein CVT25_008813 [Psilocybe cyanescens]|uniref:Uncharacterized protein n=1 Tax=Psilocybe cyanescens TaxID=93625 RepID=A0A409XN42_PSICY|nr:hypothetical protein CVT25_008813 [Psilocybe cyanescens]